MSVRTTVKVLELQSAQLAHALVGAAEAHATRAEQAYRDAGAQPADLIQASLMAFAAVNRQNERPSLSGTLRASSVSSGRPAGQGQNRLPDDLDKFGASGCLTASHHRTRM
jgi:hypothetical protein